MRNKFKKPDRMPADMTDCLIIMNGLMYSGYMFKVKHKGFCRPTICGNDLVEHVIKLSKVEAWVEVAHVPFPSFAPKRAPVLLAHEKRMGFTTEAEANAHAASNMGA